MIYLEDHVWEGYNTLEMTNYKEKYHNVLKKVMINHVSSCKLTFNTCNLCQCSRSNQDILTYSYENHLLLFNILYGMIQKDKKLIQENHDKYRLITSFHRIKTNLRNAFCHSLVVIDILCHSKEKPAFILNLMIYYKNYIKINKMVVIKVENIYFVENESKELQAFIKQFNETLFYEEKKPKSIISAANSLYTKMKNIKNKLYERKTKSDYYSIIIQFMIESLTNTKLNFKDKTMFDITTFDEFLNEHYNDQTLILTYEYETKMAMITFAGNELISYVNKPFAEIFHSRIRENAMEYFNNCINNTITQGNITTKNFFSFPFSEKDNESSIMHFKLKYTLMPSIFLTGSLITGLYQTNCDDAIMSITNNKTQEETLLAYSKLLTRHIIIPNIFLRILNQFNYDINIDSLLQYTDKGFKHNDYYSIDYKKYLPFAKSRLHFLTSEIKDSAIQLKLPKLGELTQYQKKVKKFELRDKVVYHSTKLSTTCVVYSFINEDNTTKPKKNDFLTKNSLMDDNMFAAFQNTRTTTTNNYSGQFMNSNSSVDIHQSNSSSTKYLNGLSIEARQKLTEELLRKKKELKKFKTLTYIIILFNTLLVILTIVFLVVDIDSILQFQEMFSFFQLWNEFICLFFNTSISVFANVCVAPVESKNCTNTLDFYAEDFNKATGLPDAFLIGKYLKYELTVKADMLQSLSKDVIRHIYTKMGRKAISVLDAPYYYRYLTFHNSSLDVNAETFAFLNGLDIYINLINVLVNNLQFTELPIYIINIIGMEIDDIYLDNIDLDSFTNIQMTEYNILLNYPKFIGSFMELNDIMSDQLRLDINNCYNIINAFTILLVVIHLGLFTICMIFITFFQNVIEEYYNESRLKISQIPLMIAVKEKLMILSDLLQYYKDEPYKLVDQYNSLAKAFAAEIAEIAKKSNAILTTIESNKQKKKLKLQRTFTIFNGIIDHKTLIILFSSFSFYCLYSLLFYLLSYVSIVDYNHLIRTVDYGSNLDIYLYGSFGIIQMMILTNQSDYEIASYLNVQTTKGYVRNLMDQSYYYLSQIEKDESNHQSLIPRLRDFIDINCDTLYITIKDELLTVTDAKYTERSYIKEMPKICKGYAFMKMKNDKVMINSLMLLLNKIQLSMTYDPVMLLVTKNSMEVFDLNVITLILYRPIRIYEANALNTKIISEMTIKYNTITYIYLISNIFIEIGLFLMLRTYIVKSCIQIQKSMNMFVKCLKV